MNEAVQFISEAGVFYIATVDGNEPKVRPFGAVFEDEGKVYFVTGNQKDVYKQLQANPHFEVSATAKDGRWIRLKGKAVFDDNLTVKIRAFDMFPSLKNIYHSPESPIFEAFYVTEGEATIYSFGGETKAIKL